jgi:DNA polymerase-1
MITLTGQREGIKRLRGSYQTLLSKYDYDCPVLICLHPAAVARDRDWIKIATRDLKKLHDFVMYGLPKPVKYDFQSEPTAEELYEYLNESVWISFDTEGTGLNKRHDDVIGMSFAKDNHSAMDFDLVPNDPRLEVAKAYLENPKSQVVLQNASYDLEMMRQSCNVHIPIEAVALDTLLAEQMLNPDLPANLDQLRAMYTDMPPYKPDKKAMKNIARWSKEDRSEYANKDAVCTRQVATEQFKLLQPSQRKLLNELLMPVIPALNQMERRGVVIDRDRAMVCWAELQPELQRLAKIIQDECGINPGSPVQIKKYFGFKSADKTTMQREIDRGHPKSDLIDAIMKWRGLDKFAGTFLVGLIKRLELNPDNNLWYIHTSYRADATGTGRLSSSNPNLQNIVEDYRVLYISEPGTVFISGDYAQVELRCGAIVANCQKLLDDLDSGVDIHEKFRQKIQPYLDKAVGIRGTSIVGKQRPRVVAKVVVFGTFYGASPYSFAKSFGVPVAIAKAWQDELFAEYPEIHDYIQARREEVRTTGMVHTPWGRIRYVDNERQGINTPIQSSASDVTLSTLLELYKRNVDLRLTIHDDLIFQAPEGDYMEIARMAREIYERPIPQMNGYSFKADFKVGKNWGDMEKIEF